MARLVWTEFTATLTREHLDQGKACRFGDCPLALAISEAIGAFRLVGVTVDGRVIVRQDAARGVLSRHVEAVMRKPEQCAEIVHRIDAGRAAEVETPQVIVFDCPFPALQTLT